MTKNYITILKINMADEVSLKVILRKIDETRDYL